MMRLGLISIVLVAALTGSCADNPRAATASAGAHYLNALLDIAEAKSVNSRTLDWSSVRSQVLAAAGSAETIQDTYPAIALALSLLDDRESYYTASDGHVIGPPPVGGCSGSPPPEAPPLPDNVRYVKVDSCLCEGAALEEFADAVQLAIRTSDGPGLAGWIVDLRGNFGGNMWPMIAGLGPLLGEGIVGYLVENDREYERAYRGGTALNAGEPFARATSPYMLLDRDLKVAVLTDGATASAGEAVAVFFRGRARTRSFGAPTCGHHQLQLDSTLTDGAMLSLVTSQHADRTRRRYAGPITPDETVDDASSVVERAVAWLTGNGTP
jgi:carboxyl-terminal processing protease